MAKVILGTGIARIVVGSGNNRQSFDVPSDADAVTQDKFREGLRQWVRRGK